MGCLNSDENFEHWFGNIHLSGPCNRSCYFCIGQHMMALDPLNVLDKWPLPGLDRFMAVCVEHGVSEINLTGSNTDPLMYRHLAELRERLVVEIPALKFGLRTNGALALSRLAALDLFDKVSISLTSFRPSLYALTMGSGSPPDIGTIRELYRGDIKLNVVLCPETVQSGDILATIATAGHLGISRVNLREPYGQPHIGDPLAGHEACRNRRFGMAQYFMHGVEVTYWDVHYVEVESVNLYANGRVSMTYPVTAGHDPNGIVLGQEHFTKSGRVREQWLAPVSSQARSSLERSSDVGTKTKRSPPIHSGE